MSDYAVPALIAAVLNLILALINGFFRRFNRINLSFAIFTACIALMSISFFYYIESTSESQTSFWFRLAFISFSLITYSAMYFFLILTGYNRRLDEKIFYVKLKYYLVYVFVFMIMLNITTLGTNLIFSWETMSVPVDLYHINNPVVMYILSGLSLPIILIFYSIPIKALKETKNKAKREFILLNLIATLFVFTSDTVSSIFLPMNSLDYYALVFSIIIVASVIYYVAIVRYQFRQIEELNIGLEQKVDERTRNLRETQTRLVQSEKMASLGRLVAGVAHEFNNPIGAAHSATGTLKDGLKKLDEFLAQNFQIDDEKDNINRILRALNSSSKVIDEGTNRVASIVKKMKSFAHLDESDFQIFDLHRCIEETLNFLPTESYLNVKIVRDYDDLPRIACHPARVNQLFMNLFQNSIEAMRDGKGELRIKTTFDDDNVSVNICDNGIGIPEENLSRLFDPGFTTKSRGIGTGLGLAICYQVMEEHRGTIEITSNDNEGTEVRLKFPLR